MHLEDDFSLDELARALAARFKPAGLLYLSGALQAIAEQQLSGLTPEETLAGSARNHPLKPVEAGLTPLPAAALQKICSIQHGCAAARGLRFG